LAHAPPRKRRASKHVYVTTTRSDCGSSPLEFAVCQGAGVVL